MLLPLSLASLLTGLGAGAGHEVGWSVHYWAVVKLGITVLAMVVLLSYMQTLGAFLADAARESAMAGGDVEAVRSASPLLHAAAALVLLVTARRRRSSSLRA